MIFSSFRAISENYCVSVSSFCTVIFAPEKNFVIDTRKNSICLKLAPVKMRKASVTMNMREDLRFLLPCASKFLKMMVSIFLSFGKRNMKTFTKAFSS